MILRILITLLLVCSFFTVVDIATANPQIIKPVKYGDNFSVTENFVICNAKIGDNFICGAFSVIGENDTAEVKIGDNVTIGNFVIIKAGAKIGNHVIIHDRVTIGAYEIIDDSQEIFYNNQY